MKSSQSMRSVMTAVALGMMAAPQIGINAPQYDLRNYSPRKQKQGKAGSSVLRGYYAKHSHVLTEHVTNKNLARAANGKSGFKGFRKVRKFIPSGNHELHPNQGMSVWVAV